MMLRNVYYIILVLLLVACDNSNDNNGSNLEATDYEFYVDVVMEFIDDQGFDTLDFRSGNNTVFKYFYKAADEEDIADDEYAESIYFQIDGSLDSFSYTNEELRALDLFIRRSCFCASVGFVFPEIGTVSGTKLSNGNWNVNISITFEWDEFSQTDTRTIEGVFRLEPTP